jgi:hypothetical protein
MKKTTSETKNMQNWKLFRVGKGQAAKECYEIILERK